MAPPGFAGATAGAGPPPAGAAGGASSVQPATAIARARLESIDKAWIAVLTFTGALLESCVTKQIISIFKSQLTHASGPQAAKTVRETICPIRQSQDYSGSLLLTATHRRILECNRIGCKSLLFAAGRVVSTRDGLRPVFASSLRIQVKKRAQRFDDYAVRRGGVADR
jgi:hypothetical protein